MILFLVIGLWGVCVTSQAGAEELTVVTEEWPPYNYTEEGRIIGVVTEVVRAVLEKTDLKWEIQMFPWARAYKMAQMQENVMIYTIFKLPNREHLFKWIKIEGLSTQMYLYSPSSRPDIQIACLEDAKKYKTGVTRETSTHHFLISKGFQEGVNLFPVTSEIQNAFKADPKRQSLDLTTGDRLSLAMWLKKYNFPADYWQRQVFLFKEDFYMGFSQKTPDAVVEKVRTALKQIQSEGILDAILEKYNRMYP
jgi:polar amino acid transport system substrate-binding protein